MNELERLEMLVKHYEDKEKRLIEWIKEAKEKANNNARELNNYNLQMNWQYYDRALRSVLKQIEVLERVIDG